MKSYKDPRVLTLGAVCTILFYFLLKSKHFKQICIGPDSKLLFEIVKFSQCDLKCLREENEERMRHYWKSNFTISNKSFKQMGHIEEAVGYF